jgi:hypothetical protein
MIKKLYSIILLLLFTACAAKQVMKGGQQHTASASPLAGVQKWFHAWELVSKQVYHIHTLQPVEFVFFDDQYMYATSPVSIPEGAFISGPTLLGKTLAWKKALHNGKLKLPDGQELPIGLMSFAAPLDSMGQTAFFVMPLPDFWEKAGVTSKELGLDHLVTGVFLHEFSHTQQMQSFGKKMTDFERDHAFKVAFSDDIIQDYFENDSMYNKAFRQEVKTLYEAVAATPGPKQQALIREGMTMFERRQQQYFTGEQAILTPIDNFFLTMEGIGQYSMYAWLVHPQGGNVSAVTAIAGVRRGGKWWSQEEGFALFLILDKLSKPKHWSKGMFGNETICVIAWIHQEMRP